MRASPHAERYIATLANELARTDYAADAGAFLAEAGVNLDTTPRLIGVQAAGLAPAAANTLISKLLRLRAVAHAGRETVEQA